VVTNNYLEFWLRYASLLEEAEVMTGNQPELACSLLQGACLSGRLARRADALAAWAELEEQCGRAARARLLLDAGLSSCGRGSTELALRRAALESRHHDCTKAVELLQQLAGQASSTASRAILSRRLARLCEDHLRQPDKAYECMMTAWRAGCREPGLLVELTSLIMRGEAFRGENPLTVSMSLFEEALHAEDSGGAEGCHLWACYVDFLLTNGAPLATLRGVQARARKFRSQASRAAAVSESQKRGPDTQGGVRAKQARHSIADAEGGRSGSTGTRSTVNSGSTTALKSLRA